MPINYPLTYPTDLKVSAFQIALQNVASISVSPYTLAQQVQEYDGQLWRVSFTISPFDRAEAEVYNAFIAELRGRVGTFLMSPHGFEEPRGVVTGTISVNGGSQTGNDLNIDGLPLSTSNVFRVGDFIQIGTGSSTKLYKILRDVDSDGSGEATLLVAPSIKVAHADNAEVIYTNPKGHFRLDDNAVFTQISPPFISQINVSASEVL